MLKQLTAPIVVTGLMMVGTPLAASDLPKPNAEGDYERAPHPYWMVVDPDPSGLNCRMGRYSYNEILDPRNAIPLDFLSLPVVGTFSQGDRFQTDLGPAGFGRITDTRGKPWLYVMDTDANGAPSHCFVRANNQFVIPVEPR